MTDDPELSPDVGEEPVADGPVVGAPVADAFDWGEPSSDVDEGPTPDVLRFEIGGLSFAVGASYVAEVTAPLRMTRVPGLPAYIAGVAVRRSHVLTVVDLANFLDVSPDPEHSRSERLLVFDVDGLEAGAVVDAVSGLELWPDDSESAKLLENVSPRIRPFALGARWAPGGVIVLLDAADLIRAAAVR